MAVEGFMCVGIHVLKDQAAPHTSSVASGLINIWSKTTLVHRQLT